jgi:plasmid stabilization system protein ParE
MPVLFHRLAAQEFVTARRWYFRRSAQAEARFVTAVADTLRVVEANPLLAPAYLGSYRWQRVRRFLYVLYFEPIAPGTVYVYAVAHAGRRPGYWLRRVNRP